MTTFFIVIEIIAIIVIFFALGILLFGSSSREQKLMVFFMLGVLIHNCGYLLELTAMSLEVAVTATKMQYLGSLFIPLLYCWFIFSYSYEKIPERIIQLLTIVDVVMYAIVFTCDRHTFYYRDLKWLVTSDGHHYMSITYGPGYVICILCSCIFPYCMSFYALLHATICRPEQAKSRRYKLLTVLSVMPVLALLSYALKLTDIYDLTPSVLGLVLSLVVILLWRKRIYDFRSMASDIVLNSMGDGVIALDDQKRIVSYNQAAAGIFPDLSMDAIGENISFLQNFPDDVLENIDEKREFMIRERFYEGHIKKITEKNADNRGYVILLLDITETQTYIDEIKRVREQAERANMAKSEFLANMSHEIRTPMNAIVGLSDIIMEESRGRKVYSYANDIKSASHNLLSIINDILDLSKVEAGKMELVMVDYYIKSIVGSVSSIMDINASLHGLLLKTEYDNSIPCRYYGDEGKIRQVLINLLNNAVKFTKEGYVKLSISGTPGEDGMENLVFAIEDTGCGIKKEDLDMIFEDFQQVDTKRNRTVEGTGLGLSISKHFVELMNGSIRVESVYGIGTVFTITIPQKIVDTRTLEEVPEAPPEEKEKVRPFTVIKPYKVLVVDDNLVNRRVAIGFLKRYGFKLSEAASGAEAIEQVRSVKFDIIFMDHMMPEMDGVEAVHIIRDECGENGREPIIIALTANAMEGVREMFLQNGFQDFLAKPLYRKPMNEILMKWIPEEHREYVEEDPEEKKAGSGMDYSDIHIQGIDVEEAMLHHSGEVTDYIELLRLYCTDGKRKLKLLRDLYEAKDYAVYEVEVHALKSASANMGAMELSEKAKAHEYAVKDGNTDYIQLHFTELISNYEELLENIRIYLERTFDSNKTVNHEELPEIDRNTLLSEIREALQSIETFHSRDGAARLDGLLKYRLDSETETAVKNTREQLSLYEDDEAEKMLRELIDRLEKEI